MRRIFYTTLLFLSFHFVSGQKINSEYKTGYALKGIDTLKCKLYIDTRTDYPKTSIKLLIGDEEITFFAGGPITGFGVEETGESIHYGIIVVERVIRTNRMVNLMYIKKMVAGVIDFYEYSYSIERGPTQTANGVWQRNSTSNITQNTTNYYIAKTDSAAPGLITPVVLPSFRKKDLEPYLSDNVELFANIEKKISIKELVAAIKEYNAWYLEKKKSL
jgi:hypothetical protein